MATFDHIEGFTWHGRFGPIKNDFRYGIDYLLLDPEAPVPKHRFFNHNKRGLFALFDRDYGGMPGKGRGAMWAREVLTLHAPEVDGKLLLLTQPRVLGYIFNPISLWIGFDKKSAVRAIIAEVTNTFGQRHCYLVRHENGAEITAQDQITAQKFMHVSPFQPVEGSYVFRFDFTERNIGLWIEYRHGAGGVLATFTGKRRPFQTGRWTLRMLRRPFGSLRVTALIHWQALILWRKGAKYRQCPANPERFLTLPDHSAHDQEQCAQVSPHQKN